MHHQEHLFIGIESYWILIILTLVLIFVKGADKTRAIGSTTKDAIFESSNGIHLLCQLILVLFHVPLALNFYPKFIVDVEHDFADLLEDILALVRIMIADQLLGLGHQNL